MVVMVSVCVEMGVDVGVGVGVVITARVYEYTAIVCKGNKAVIAHQPLLLLLLRVLGIVMTAAEQRWWRACCGSSATVPHDGVVPGTNQRLFQWLSGSGSL